MATGGGAYKFYDRMKEILHVDVIREDEMECLIIGESDQCGTLSVC
jgi:type II pantothenate kinase